MTNLGEPCECGRVVPRPNLVLWSSLPLSCITSRLRNRTIAADVEIMAAKGSFWHASKTEVVIRFWSFKYYTSNCPWMCAVLLARILHLSSTNALSRSIILDDVLDTCISSLVSILLLYNMIYTCLLRINCLISSMFKLRGAI